MFHHWCLLPTRVRTLVGKYVRLGGGCDVLKCWSLCRPTRFGTACRSGEHAYGDEVISPKLARGWPASHSRPNGIRSAATGKHRLAELSLAPPFFRQNGRSRVTPSVHRKCQGETLQLGRNHLSRDPSLVPFAHFVRH